MMQTGKNSLAALLEEAEEKYMEWIEVFDFCRYKGKTGFVRVIAHKNCKNIEIYTLKVYNK